MNCPSCNRPLSSLSSACANCSHDPLSLYTCQQPTCQHTQPVGQQCKRCAHPLTGPLSGKSIPWNSSTLYVRERIGGGGMGDVYRAFEVQHDHIREVALKCNKDCSNKDRYLRFKREVHHLSAVQSPFCVSIFGYGEYIDPESEVLVTQFMCMELLRGQTLEQALTEGPFSHRDATAVCEQLAHALDALHQLQLLHRDLNANNVMLLSLPPSPIQVKLFDFGLAKELTDNQPLSESGIILGTLWYMSPEQARGEQLDHRSDIFSLGVLLYQCITGRLPYPARNLYELYQLHQQGPMSISEPLPDHLLQFLDRSLAFSPERRWQQLSDTFPLFSAPHFQATAPFLPRKPTASTPPPPPLPQPSLPKALIWGLSALLVISVGISMFFFFLANQPTPPPMAKQKPQRNQPQNRPQTAQTSAPIKRKQPTIVPLAKQTAPRPSPRLSMGNNKNRPQPRPRTPKRYKRIKTRLLLQPKCQRLFQKQKNTWKPLKHRRFVAYLPPGAHVLRCIHNKRRLKRSFSLRIPANRPTFTHKQIWKPVPVKLFIRYWAIPYIDGFFLPNCQDGCRVTLWSGRTKIILKRAIVGTKRQVTVHSRTIALHPTKEQTEQIVTIRWQPSPKR